MHFTFVFFCIVRSWHVTLYFLSSHDCTKTLCQSYLPQQQQTCNDTIVCKERFETTFFFPSIRKNEKNPFVFTIYFYVIFYIRTPTPTFFIHIVLISYCPLVDCTSSSANANSFYFLPFWGTFYIQLFISLKKIPSLLVENKNLQLPFLGIVFT